LIDEFVRTRPRFRADRLRELTARELDVLRLMAIGRSNSEIAAGSTSGPRRSRPTSAGSWPSSAPATAPRPWSPPTEPGSRKPTVGC